MEYSNYMLTASTTRSSTPVSQGLGEPKLLENTCSCQLTHRRTRHCMMILTHYTLKLGLHSVGNFAHLVEEGPQPSLGRDTQTTLKLASL